MVFLVLGCNGMAGHTIGLYLHERGHEVLGFDRSPSRLISSVCGDARDTGALLELLRSRRFDYVVNCIGLLNKTAEERKADACLLNSYLPHFLAEATHDTQTKVMHMSTDCVFSGSRGGYTETDLPDGPTFYDRSKALGELDDGRNITLRNSIVGPDLNPQGIGLLNWFMQADGLINGFSSVLWTGQTTLQLAKTMEAAAMNGASGLVNAVPDHSISKYELLKLFNRYLLDDRKEIVPCAEPVSDKSLIRTNYDFDYIIPGYEEMVKEMSEWIMVHKSLYPHYSLR